MAGTVVCGARLVALMKSRRLMQPSEASAVRHAAQNIAREVWRDGMIWLLCFVAAALVSPFKSKLRLEAENAALRHQLIVLRRRLQGRVQLTNHDRWFFIQLYRWFPSILKVLTIIRPRALAQGRLSQLLALWRLIIEAECNGGATETGQRGPLSLLRKYFFERIAVEAISGAPDPCNRWPRISARALFAAGVVPPGRIRPILAAGVCAPPFKGSRSGYIAQSAHCANAPVVKTSDVKDAATSVL
jgi:hypothetical protein